MKLGNVFETSTYLEHSVKKTLLSDMSNLHCPYREMKSREIIRRSDDASDIEAEMHAIRTESDIGEMMFGGKSGS